MAGVLELLFDALVDYAGTFPPASLTLGDALAEYARIKAGPDGWLVGRFVISASQLGDFERLAPSLTKGECWRLSLLVALDSPSPREVVERFNDRWSSSAQIAAVEFPPLPIGRLGTFAGLPPHGVELFVETPLGIDLQAHLEAVKRAGASAKVRTGGISPEAIPTAEQLVRFLSLAREAGVAFKATAGLHHALRGSYPLTYAPGSACATMHGFLNLIVAAALLFSGGSVRDAEVVLRESSAEAFAFHSNGLCWNGHTIAMKDWADIRHRYLRSFASCDLREPLTDLRRLHSL